MALRTETKKFLILFYTKIRVSLSVYTSLYQSPFSGFQHFCLWEPLCHLVNSFSVGLYQVYIFLSHLDCECLGNRDDELVFYLIFYISHSVKDSGLFIESSWYKFAKEGEIQDQFIKNLQATNCVPDTVLSMGDSKINKTESLLSGVQSLVGKPHKQWCQSVSMCMGFYA